MDTIADLFPEVTVLFADIAGFTAWSSTREPSQVFFLLESIYKCFDKAARRMRVFKVETIGDSYVAATGLPVPRKDHAEVMASFAFRCLSKMNPLVHSLELTLGPGTADLKMRFGIHSGPVTAGVLRGEKSRFQLFGDTVNTAARMESTGIPDRIQVSKETADLLIKAGKADWVRPRETLVSVKGKGSLNTFWLNASSRNAASTTKDSIANSSDLSENFGSLMKANHSMFARDESASFSAIDKATQRLILWNVENLLMYLKKIVASRPKRSTLSDTAWKKLKLHTESRQTLFDEVEDVISLPSASKEMGDFQSVLLDDTVVHQLIHLVSTIAKMYNANNFHNFAHASHVTQSVSKLLSRVVTPTLPQQETTQSLHQVQHDYTYGITSDPLTQFSLVLVALIHDVDHPGVSNATLVAEGHDMARLYQNQSVAEQNSVSLVWDLLMEPTYEALRKALYQSQEELERFRSLLVNNVLATDVMDQELALQRKARWEQAFSGKSDASDDDSMVRDRKATIVMEHIIQASDVCHTMQHWKVYIDWNEKLFRECHQAFCSGRASKPPAQDWYENELKFFDFYVIPLAKKLKDCSVFGVSSDEYLTYAQSNRDEWASRGHEMIAGYMSGIQSA